ncbi:dynamin family protein [Opisthorchis viverrini]|uniref:Dynamin family protein n=2 Tax=Opisthorchis viverrini TaxID=6198 RepID=A0A1S8X9A1_OPIVI|nr:dynamin family protein [Opisthorchis viverrini]
MIVENAHEISIHTKRTEELRESLCRETGALIQSLESSCWTEMQGVFKKNTKPKDQEAYASVIDGLSRLYTQKLLPLETTYKFHEFHSPALEKGDFESKPMVLLIGQYSTGKTTFIRYLLGQDFPGIRIGPEPTTDSFIAVMYNEREGVIPGNALVADHKKQFRPLDRFGNNFLNRFQCAHLPNEVLESITFIDTPGILSGEKQRLDRGYDFSGVIEWFAERVDRIILLFDAHKLDISDEFKRVIEVLKGNEDKIRIVLNKADMVDAQQLMRVYGALMWSLGKILYTPEVARVYIGSFWDRRLLFDTNRKLFELEQRDLFRDLSTLPGDAALRKLNDIIRRARLAKVHAYIIGHLKNEMPAIMGKDAKKKELINNLGKVYETLSRLHHISLGDFPNVQRMQECLALHDFRTFPSLQPKLVKAVDDMLSNDMAKLMQMIPQEQKANAPVHEPVRGGAFDSNDTPFSYQASEGINQGMYDSEWIVSRERAEADSIFLTLDPVNGKISGASARSHMIKSQLPNSTLRKIWILGDVDRDGYLDEDEFALVCHLIKLQLQGDELPTTLPKHLIPPSKRQTAQEPIENGHELNY